jgi:hypothetical protein
VRWRDYADDGSLPLHDDLVFANYSAASPSLLERWGYKRTSIFRLKSCLPTALGCHFFYSGDFGTSPFFGQHLVNVISLTAYQATTVLA